MGTAVAVRPLPWRWHRTRGQLSIAAWCAIQKLCIYIRESAKELIPRPWDRYVRRFGVASFASGALASLFGDGFTAIFAVHIGAVAILIIALLATPMKFRERPEKLRICKVSMDSESLPSEGARRDVLLWLCLMGSKTIDKSHPRETG
jgi:hypothetical protein